MPPDPWGEARGPLLGADLEQWPADYATSMLHSACGLAPDWARLAPNIGSCPQAHTQLTSGAVLLQGVKFYLVTYILLNVCCFLLGCVGLLCSD